MEGDEVWDTGWSCYGDAGPWKGRGVDSLEVQMRSSFDDHMSDLAQRGLVPDRAYDDLPVAADVPDTLKAFLEEPY